MRKSTKKAVKDAMITATKKRKKKVGGLYDCIRIIKITDYTPVDNFKNGVA